MKESHTRLVLIKPPQPGLIRGFTAGLISLANYVTMRMPACEAQILDLSDHSRAQASERVANSCRRLQNERVFVGVTTSTATYQAALSVARIAKAAHPESIVVFGGPHASADFATVLTEHEDLVDFVVIGEGEKPLCALLHNYPAIDNIPGIAVLSDGGIMRTPPPSPLSTEELDSIPVTYGANGLVGTPGKFDHVTYVSARGCPRECAFCSVGGAPIRTKSISAVVRDIGHLLDMGVSQIAIEDNFFAHSPGRTRGICQALADISRRQHGMFAWDCQTRVEALARPDVIPLMADAGCDAVYIGVESVDTEHLRFLNKTNQPTKYLKQLSGKVIPALLDSCIDCFLNLQFGLPGETAQHGEKTISFLGELGTEAQSRGKVITVFPQLYVIYPGTRHCHKAFQQEHLPTDVFESFTAWEARKPSLRLWLGEYFAHGAGGVPVGVLRSAPLRKGRYEIDCESMARISTTLRKLDHLPGIRAFQYSRYIVSEQDVKHHSKNVNSF